MREICIVWLLLILCVQVLSISTPGRMPLSNEQGDNLSNAVMQELGAHGVNRTEGVFGYEKRYVEKNEFFRTGRGLKGKGASGGANVKPRARKSAAAVSAKPSFLVLTTVSYICLHSALAMV